MGSKQYTEQDIIRGCRRGKRQAQELLYRQYYSFGMSVCLRYTYSRDDAMEVLNDSFMKVFDHIHDFDEHRPFKAWFRRILVNTALDHYRSLRRINRHISLDDPEYEATEPSDESHLHETDLQIDADEILELFGQLPDVYRLTFNMYEVEGYSHDEIAGKLDISPGTSRSNLSRAKKMLRTLYEKQRKDSCHEAV